MSGCECSFVGRELSQENFNFFLSMKFEFCTGPQCDECGCALRASSVMFISSFEFFRSFLEDKCNLS